MKILKKLLKLFIFLVILAITFIGVSIYLITDSTSLDPKYDESTNTATYEVNSLISKSLSKTQSTEQLNFTFTEEEISYLLSSITKSFNSALPKQLNLRGTTVDFTDQNEIKLSLFANYLFFQTTFRSTVEIQTTNEEIILKLNNASLGKIQVDGQYISKTLNKFISNEDLNNKIQEKGFDVTFDLKTLTITINKDNFQAILEEKFGKDSNKELYHSLIDIIFNNELVEMEETSDKFGFIVNLSQLSNQKVIENAEPYFHDYASIKEKCEKLLNENIINQEQLQYVFNFLTQGYDAIKNNSEYSFINTLNLSSISINDIQSYEGVFNHSTSSIETIIDNQEPSIVDILLQSFNIYITSQDLTNIFYETRYAGQAYTFSHIDTNNKINVSYIVLESIYTKIIEDKLSIYFILNLNGYKTNIECNLETTSTNNLSIKTIVSSMKFGNIELNETHKKQILSLINTITANEEWFTINADDMSLSIDLTKQLKNNASFNEIIEYAKETNIELIEDKLHINIKTN